MKKSASATLAEHCRYNVTMQIHSSISGHSPGFLHTMLSFRRAAQIAIILLASAALIPTTFGGDAAAIVDPWGPATSESAISNDLFQEYNNIFRHGNRNAASHRWATFLLDRANQMTEARLTLFFESFCAVSGSPVRPSDFNRYRLTLPKLGGGFSTGYMHYCCWPCVCDTQDYIRVDTKTISLANGVNRTFQFAVIGNPCDKPDELTVPFIQPFDRRETSIAESAREVRCENGKLEGATLSDSGYPIIGMFFDSADAIQEDDGIAAGAMDDIPDPTPGRMSSVVTTDTSGRKQFQDEREYSHYCKDRADNGYNSGMGEIFRRVSAVSPITNEALHVLGAGNGADAPPSCTSLPEEAA